MSLDLSASGGDDTIGLVNRGSDIAIQAVYTGSPTGTFKLQASIDGVNWADIDGSSVDITTAGTNMWTVSDAFYNFMRVYYTRTSGSGTLTTMFTIKRNLGLG